MKPGTLLAAYRAGAFPMGCDPERPGLIDWWSPDPRGVLFPQDLRVTRSMRRSARRFTVTVDTAFADVVGACADPSRDGAWITAEIHQAYARLHRMGWAHSVECWTDDRLVGGLYGVAIGGLFAGESMFHRVPDASKVALMALVHLVGRDRDERRLIDVQWTTDHLISLGAVDLDRDDYRERLRAALLAEDLDWTSPPLPADLRQHGNLSPPDSASD